MRRVLRRWADGRDPAEEGQGLAEYALILALIALVCVAALGTLGQAIANSPGFSVLPGSL
ncbi:hypothetical protein [Tepidiforma sp.]|uniref:Flp family type IVb pilin n=1 Tax=Tepidiforma sp. TaxID=2682230 RepID=UPI002ADE7917|nr:hypothetical protein [Tepidiforma sp.]